MRLSNGRRRALRVARLEQIEPRLLMSADYGFTGAGQTVAVIDSGIAYDHVALGGGFGDGYRVVGGFDFTEEQDGDPYDDGPRGSHGTHVAGIVGSSDVTHPGVAPGVDLVALRVFNDQGQGKFTWVEEALQWVHDNRDAFENPITTVNLSLGGNWNSDDLPDWAILEDELAQLEADGIFISVAAGNRFTSYNATGLSYPAASSHVVPVASVDPSGQLSYFSQRDQRVIAAPGRGIMSTVPDYRGNGNGVDDDFAKYSGTSMAAPYVAGASVLLREAYEFVGIEDVTQSTLYDLMVGTADTVYDSITQAGYYRLNLDAAMDAVMPEDDFGSTAGAAHGLGTLVDTLSLVGTLGRPDDADWFQFTAARSGTVTFAADMTHALVAQWEVAGGAGGVKFEDGQLSFEVVAGESYAVGLSSDAGLGHYTIDATLEACSQVVDFGPIGQELVADNRITDAGEWFSLVATNDGILTVEALLAQAGSQITLEFHDANQRLLGSSQDSGDTHRIDIDVSAGDRLFLRATAVGPGAGHLVDFRLTNLVSQTGSTVNVLGTNGDDTFDFAAGTTHRLAVNGVEYAFAGSTVGAVQFDGGEGSDTAVLTGTSGAESAQVRVGSAEMRGSGYQVSTADVENLTLRGGPGSDTVTFFDSAGDDTFVATLDTSTLRCDGFLNKAEGFERARALATAGGVDAAHFYDSSGNDTFVATTTYGKLQGAGFYLRAEGFQYLHGHATAGGSDRAYFRDTAGDDTFLATPHDATLTGSGFTFRADAFDYVYAYATEGGRDTARLFDSAGNDVFLATPTYAKLQGAGFTLGARYFEHVHTEANVGGRDVATLQASGPADRLEASGTLARLLSEATVTELYGFELVRAQATQGSRNTAETAATDFVLELLGQWDA